MIRVTRRVTIPDATRLNRYLRNPDLGPRLLFFSGGSALNPLSRVLKRYTHHSTHLMTPFDSGGSSAKLREAFDMPSIGDIRSRLMALSDETHPDQEAIFRLFTYRFPKQSRQEELVKQLSEMVAGHERRVAAIANPMRKLIRNQLGYFHQQMPESFDLRGASIGNLILAGGYLNNHQHLEPIIFLFSKLVNVLGMVRAIVNRNVHLAARLKDGSMVHGQHRITGKENPPITSPIQDLFFSSQRDRFQATEVVIKAHTEELIQQSDLICYPMGSFFTSVLANIMPGGVRKAIGSAVCPRVYVPNQGVDPEQMGMGVNQCVGHILDSHTDHNQRLLDFVLLDRDNGQYPGFNANKLKQEWGIETIDVPLITTDSAPFYNPKMLAEALLSLA